MQHYLCESQAAGDLTTNFPHGPTDFSASFQDYLEDKLANGYSLVSVSWNDQANHMDFVFQVVAK